MPLRSSALIALPCATAIVLGACGSKAIPPELLDARVAFQRAEAGETKRVDPAGTFEARKALDTAERRQQESPGSRSAEDAAYVALRKVQLAEVNAESALAKASTPSPKAGAARGVRPKADTSPGTPGERGAKTAPAQAEARAAEDGCSVAARTLGSMFPVRVEGKTITLVLGADAAFAGRTSTLTPRGDEELTTIAETVRQHVPRAEVEVYGFSDHLGSEARNAEVVDARVDAVRDRLATGGVKVSRVEAIDRNVGGAATSSASPEDRASRRRLELVIRTRGAE